MILTEKQKSWLSAALIATGRDGPVFKRATLRNWLDLPIEESTRIAQSLQREGLVTLLPGDEAILTDRGRHAAADGDVPPDASQQPDVGVPHEFGIEPQSLTSRFG